MTTIKQSTKTLDIKREVQQIRTATQKAAATRKSARDFLVSTGMYTASGQIKAQYR